MFIFIASVCLAVSVAVKGESRQCILNGCVSLKEVCIDRWCFNWTADYHNGYHYVNKKGETIQCSDCYKHDYKGEIEECKEARGYQLCTDCCMQHIKQKRNRQIEGIVERDSCVCHASLLSRRRLRDYFEYKYDGPGSEMIDAIFF